MKGKIMHRPFYLFLILIIFSCSRHPENITYQTTKQVNSDDNAYTEGITVDQTQAMERKVIYNIYFSLEADYPDTVINNLQTMAKSYKGYIVSIRKNNLTIRIPAAKSSGFIKEIENAAKVKDKHISGKDITEEYVDLEIKIDNLEKARQRYLELLAKAEDVTATLNVEKELERIQRQLDLLKGREKKLSHLVEYVTIDIDVNVGVKPGPLGYIFVGLYKAAKWLFVW